MNDATRIFGLLQGYFRDSRETDGPETVAKCCQWPGCGSDAEHKAPAAPSQPDKILWFCRAHAREHNAGWDFFDGMSSAEIEQFRHEDVTLHKPTWKLGANSGKWWQNAEFPGGKEFFGDTFRAEPGKHGGRPPPRPSGPVREALSVLRLNKATNWGEIKVQYKKLVKRHHPDANGGSKKAENKLKQINNAYDLLKECYRQ